MERKSVIVVGAGPAGLATAACLRRRDIPSVVLEKADSVAPAWFRHYDRLHLHTNKAASGLPYRPMPSFYPRYPSREQVATYLVDYADKEQVDARLSVEVTGCSRVDDLWQVSTDSGSFAAEHLVIATGLSHHPYLPEVPGRSAYRGEVLHTADYRNGEPYRGRDVLVVGFGNSAGEIALDLHEHGARPAVSVRNPAVVVPRDIAGIPILTIARALNVLPPGVADLLSKPLLRALVGDVRKVGIPAAPWGPLEQIAVSGKIPLLDVGTMKALHDGHISARPGIESFTETGMRFVDGTSDDYAAVVFGTGYRAEAGRLIEDARSVVDERGRAIVSGGPTAIPGLWFCGFHEPPTGRLREISREARRIAVAIAA